MGFDSKDLPPPYEAETQGSPKDILDPATFVLTGRSVVSDTTPNTPIYQMNWSVTSIPQKGSSVIFERVEDDLPLEAKNVTSIEQLGSRQIFYLAHPAGAQYQTDSPAYYLTSVTPESPGNISLEASQSRFQKTEFKMLLSKGKTWLDKPLFNRSPELLFKAKPRWMGGCYTWSDSSGRQLAYEDDKGGQHKLLVTMPIAKDIRDALVATWCLRLWYETAESTQAKRDAMERLTPIEGIQGYNNMKMVKRIGALGSLGGAGA
ncbi:hypothetical protein F4804DRAFT_325637 [Jackrogersella minutella]|nr:hypothetical protein F4804DRAFT_325637 [Jackrogersella minutella]